LVAPRCGGAIAQPEMNARRAVDFELKEVLEAVGPSAALAFSAWLFLQLLQQRYSAAYARYRELVDSLRDGSDGRDGKRRQMVHDEVAVYRKRVYHMMHATNLGMAAAMLLVLALAVSAIDAVFHFEWLKYIGAPAIIVGLLLVLPAASLLVAENMLIRQPIEAELADLGELQGEGEGRITSARRS
jgi:Protein of unknown function (DUF2721)